MEGICVDTKLHDVAAVFRVYGDNILECDNFIEWLRKEEVSGFKLENEIGSTDRPVYIFRDLLAGDTRIAFQMCPYYGGTGPSSIWKNNPLANIFDEKTDVIITQVLDDGSESSPILAVEFVDALMAGNQGWQRFRRSVNATEAGISYLYVLPIIGWERDSEGLTLKNPRYLPAQVCLAHLTLSSKFGIPSLQIYTVSSWSAYAHEKGYTLPENYKKFGGIDNAIKLACHLIRAKIDNKRNSKKPLKEILQQIIREMIIVARTYSKFSNSNLPIHYNHPVLRTEDLDTVAETYASAITDRKQVTNIYALHSIGYNDFAKFGCLFYKDAQERTTTESFRRKILSNLNWKPSMSEAEKKRYLELWGVKVTSDKESDKIALENKGLLPLTYKENKSEGVLIKNRKVLRSIIENTYPRLSQEVLNWIYPAKATKNDLSPIFLIPLYAYKPTGDSRPDRGLLPMLWSLFPSLVLKESTLVIVYSKYTPRNWKQLLEGGGNELWNSVAKFAGAIIVDITGDGMLLQNLSIQQKLL